MLQEELRITRIPTFNTFARQVRLLQFVSLSLLLISVATVRSQGKKAGSYIIHVARGLVLPLGMYTCLHTSPPQIKPALPFRGGGGRQRESRGSVRTCITAPCPASGKRGRRMEGSNGGWRCGSEGYKGHAGNAVSGCVSGCWCVGVLRFSLLRCALGTQL